MLSGVYLLFVSGKNIEKSMSLKVGFPHHYFIIVVKGEVRGSNDSTYIASLRDVVSRIIYTRLFATL
jgi:hypothetical protein